ncbi:MAG: Fe(2+)-trafficking protein [Phycisphaerales bacterium]|nr:Fe(2+)-trafficking protein [Phycisphaerales bacterium]
MSIDERIERFQHMAEADPDNEMAHFSLGSALLQAGRGAEAAGAFERCIELNRDMSKAWQLCGEAMIAAGWSDKAAATLEEGWRIAATRGDRLPQEAMGEALLGLGREVPTLDEDQQAQAAQAATTDTGFTCARTGQAGTPLEGPPFKGPEGEWIAEHISQETWSQWIGQGTKVINELRLDLSRDEDSETYDQHMREFLGMPDPA